MLSRRSDRAFLFSFSSLRSLGLVRERFQKGQYALALPLCQRSEPVQQTKLLLVQVAGSKLFDLMVNLTVADQIIHGGVKHICDPDQRFNIRLNVVIFIFID